MKKFMCSILTTFLFLGTVLPYAANAQSNLSDTPVSEDIVKETPESYEIDVFSEQPNEEGIFEKIGTKKVNANTYVEKKGNLGVFILHIKEDFYDLKGNFLYSDIIYEEAQNDFTTGKAKGKSVKKKLNKDIEIGVEKKSSKVKKSNVIKELVEEELKPIENTKFQSFDGVDYQDIELLEKNYSPESQSDFSIMATNEAAGAFDNYYNKSSDNFTAQVLGAAKYRYIQVKGKVSQNSTGYSKFKGYINTYESNVVNSMNYGSNAEQVGKWVNNIASFVQIAATGSAVLAGPGGWAVALTYISRAALFSKFAAWTSIGYATYARMDYSISAAKAQNNAQKLMTTTYFPTVTWSFPTIY